MADLARDNSSLASCWMLLQDVKKQAEVMSWLMFQMGGLGPMQGQVSTTAVDWYKAALTWLRPGCITAEDAGRAIYAQCASSLEP